MATREVRSYPICPKPARESKAVETDLKVGVYSAAGEDNKSLLELLSSPTLALLAFDLPMKSVEVSTALGTLNGTVPPPFSRRLKV